MFENWGPLSPLIALLQKLAKNPLILVIYSLLAQWYTIVVVASLLVTYSVFDGLKKAGVIDAAQNLLVKSIGEIKGVAQNCTPRIVNLNDFWACLSDPNSARYTPGPYDKDLEQTVIQITTLPTSSNVETSSNSDQNINMQSQTTEEEAANTQPTVQSLTNP